MFMPSTRRVAGAFVAAITLSLVATVAPASAAPAPAPTSKTITLKGPPVVRFDSGWG